MIIAAKYVHTNLEARVWQIFINNFSAVFRDCIHCNRGVRNLVLCDRSGRKYHP
jgi:hypothetical protein